MDQDYIVKCIILGDNPDKNHPDYELIDRLNMAVAIRKSRNELLSMYGAESRAPMIVLDPVNRIQYRWRDMVKAYENEIDKFVTNPYSVFEYIRQKGYTIEYLRV